VELFLASAAITAFRNTTNYVMTRRASSLPTSPNRQISIVNVILWRQGTRHVGPLETLAKEWDVPVYAHKLEYPI
jgi:hypothetical protein